MAKAMKCKNCGSTMKGGKCPKCDAPKGKGGKMKKGEKMVKPKTSDGYGAFSGDRD